MPKLLSKLFHRAPPAPLEPKVLFNVENGVVVLEFVNNITSENWWTQRGYKINNHTLACRNMMHFKLFLRWIEK